MDMATVGNVLIYGEVIYLVKEVKEDGSIVAQMCMTSPDEPDIISPISGITLYLSKEKVETECEILGVAEVM